MAGTLNRVTLIGRLGADPDLKYTASGKPVCNLVVATDSWAPGNEKVTQWHRIVVWGKSAESSANFLTKGSSVAIEGELTYRKWEGQNGEQKVTAEIVASPFGVVFLDSKKDSPNQGAQPQPAPKPAQQQATFPSTSSGMDEIPF